MLWRGDFCLQKNHFGRITLAKLLQNAPTDKGIYREHLRYSLTALREENKDIDLMAAMKKIITSNEPIDMESKTASKLHSMGLTKPVQGNNVTPRCDLYRRYFANQLL